MPIKQLHHSSQAHSWIQTSPTKWALFTDIDDTFLSRVRDSEATQAALGIRAQTAFMHIPLIFVTGASFAAVEKRITKGELPVPEAIISSAGTDIRLRVKAMWRQDTAYCDLLAKGGYEKSAIITSLSRFIETAHARYDVRLQDDSPLEQHKVSVHFFGTHQDARIFAQLAQNYFHDHKVIFCEEIHYNAHLSSTETILKFCLDVVPVTKADAVAYLIKALGVQGGFKAGDSGNDVDMLLAQDPLMPILVGGYKREAGTALKSHIAKQISGPFQSLHDGRLLYIEDHSDRVAGVSLLHAIKRIMDLRTS